MLPSTDTRNPAGNALKLEHLLSPVKIGRSTAKNRTVLTAHSPLFGWEEEGERWLQHLAYIRRRAEGGVGVCINQPLRINPSLSAMGEAYEYMRPRYAELIKVARNNGMLLLQQLVHPGAQNRSDGNFEPIWSFGGTVTPEFEQAHQMTDAQIEQIINGFVGAARFVIGCGVDGVELHGAHGYLIQQSFSPWGNRRADKWGDPLRFVKEILRRVREAIGAGPIMGIRLVLDDLVPAGKGGVPTERLLDMGHELAAQDGSSLDYIIHSEGSRLADYAKSTGSWRHPQGEYIGLATALKQRIGSKIPVIGVGRIVDAKHADRLIASGACDLVAMTRAHIADPEIIAKVMRGDYHRIRKCVGANQGCVDRANIGLPITCLHNSEVGREHQLDHAPPAQARKRVLVIGGGPAGLKAAEVASRRGHKVTLVEQAAEVGGRFRLTRYLPVARELTHAIDWVKSELALLDVDVRLGVKAERHLIDDLKPDVVIVATGATPDPFAVFESRPDGSVPVLSADEAMESSFGGKRVTVLDQLGVHDAMFAAELAVTSGATVSIVAPRSSIATFMGTTHSFEVPVRLANMGCALEPNWLAVTIRAGHLLLRHTISGEERLQATDWVVVSGPPVPNLGIVTWLEEAAVPFHVIGDAEAPRTALHAFLSGDKTARCL